MNDRFGTYRRLLELHRRVLLQFEGVSNGLNVDDQVIPQGL
jgi:hypothetical protein